MNCPCLECRRPNWPTAAELSRRHFARRRAAYVADAAHAILAGRSWPIGHRLGFPSLAARVAFEQKQAALVREACGESAVADLRKEVARAAEKNPWVHPSPDASAGVGGATRCSGSE